MVYLLMIVRQGDEILEFAAFDRNLAKVQFDESVVGIALRRDPCLRRRQIFIIKCVPVYIDPGKMETRPGTVLIPVDESENSVPQTQSPYGSTSQARRGGGGLDICMNELSFMHLDVEYRTQQRFPAHIACCCFQEFIKSDRFRLNCVLFFEKFARWKDMSRRHCNCEAFHTAVNCSVTVGFVIEISAKNFVPSVYYTWCYRLLNLVRKREQLEETMAWLSTLGGGFSSLGDYFISFSERAGKLSVTQLKVAIEMGDPIMAAKCRLFYALSLMQQGRLKTSKRLIWAVYHFATHFKVFDQKLVDMCHGIWSKLRYTYQQRRRSGSNGYHSNQEEYLPKRQATVRTTAETTEGWTVLNNTCTMSTQTEQMYFEANYHDDQVSKVVLNQVNM